MPGDELLGAGVVIGLGSHSGGKHDRGAGQEGQCKMEER